MVSSTATDAEPPAAPATSAPPASGEPSRISDDALRTLEQEFVSSGSAFGVALGRILGDAGPIRPAAWHLDAWLRELDAECRLEADTPPPAPSRRAEDRPAGIPRNRWQRRRIPHTGTLHQDYISEFTASFGVSPSAEDAVDAFCDGCLGSVCPDASTADDIDAYIREHPPQWAAPSEALASVCARLYVVLRSGFDVLEPGVTVEQPTDTENYRSVSENIDDVRAEVARLRRLGHVIPWSTARRRHPSLRHKKRPDHVLALGAVIKKRGDGSKKVRLVIDPSRATSRSLPRVELPGLNDSIELPTCRLPSVQQASAGLFRRCWMFKADAVDAFCQTKHSVDSLRHMGVELDSELLCYDSLCFGLRSAPAHQQRLATIFTRIVLRRWREVGIDVGDVPGPDLRIPWPLVGGRKAALLCYLDDWYAVGFSSKLEAERAYGTFIDTAAELGLQLQYDDAKTVRPCQSTDFLGVIFDSRTMRLSLSAERIAKMVADLRDIDAGDTITVAELQRLVGVLMFATVVFVFCRPYCRQMMNLLRSAGRNPAKNRRLRITADVRDDVGMWLRILSVLQLNGRPVSGLPVRRRTASVHCYTDAAFSGGGFFVGGIWSMWTWDPEMREKIGDFSASDGVFICELEALALLAAWRVIAPLFAGRYERVVCHIDNAPLVDMLLKHSSRSAACTPILKELTWLMLGYGVAIEPRWIDTESNEAADQLSRASEVPPAQLLGTLRDWTESCGDITSWSPQPPVRPDLLRHAELHPFRSPGPVYRGLGQCVASYDVTG